MSVPIQNSATFPVAGRIDFEWIGQAWALFSVRAWVWIGAIALSLLIDTVLWVLLALPFRVLASMRRDFTAVLAHTTSPLAVNPYQEFAQAQALGLLIGCVVAVFNGGLYRMALRQKRNEQISVSGIFSALPQGLPLILVALFPSFALFLLECLCLWLLHFSLSPATAIAAMNQVILIATIVPSGLLMFAPLLVLDTRATAAEALLGSVRLLRGQYLRGIFFYTVITLVSSIGFILCGVGLLATLPLSFISIAIGYLALTQPAADEPLGFDPAPPPGVWPPPPTNPPREEGIET